jgi:Arm DNA-binding domain
LESSKSSDSRKPLISMVGAYGFEGLIFHGLSGFTYDAITNRISVYCNFHRFPDNSGVMLISLIVCLPRLPSAYPEPQSEGPRDAARSHLERSVDALVCSAGKDREFLWDDALAGFGVGAFPTGRKVYVVQYRQAGRSRRATIGEHGRLTPDEERSEAKKLLGVAKAGSDPIAERRKDRAVRTFGQVAKDFLTLHVHQAQSAHGQ